VIGIDGARGRVYAHGMREVRGCARKKEGAVVREGIGECPRNPTWGDWNEGLAQNIVYAHGALNQAPSKYSTSKKKWDEVLCLCKKRSTPGLA